MGSCCSSGGQHHPVRFPAACSAAWCQRHHNSMLVQGRLALPLCTQPALIPQHRFKARQQLTASQTQQATRLMPRSVYGIVRQHVAACAAVLQCFLELGDKMSSPQHSMYCFTTLAHSPLPLCLPLSRPRYHKNQRLRLVQLAGPS